MSGSNSNPADTPAQVFTSYLYRNVSNTAEIRKQLFASKLPVVLIKPKLVVDDFQIQMAVYKAQCNARGNRLKTKSLVTEILYYLSPSKNITESLKIFSCSDEDVDLLVVADNSSYQSIKESINGDQVDLGQLKMLTDIDLIMNIYQITNEELTKSSLVDSIVSRMAAKEYYTVSSG